MTKFGIIALTMIAVAFFTFLMLLFCYAGEIKGYKQGYQDACIDFYKGKMKMNLYEKEDGTKEWIWIKEK